MRSGAVHCHSKSKHLLTVLFQMSSQHGQSFVGFTGAHGRIGESPKRGVSQKDFMNDEEFDKALETSLFAQEPRVPIGGDLIDVEADGETDGEGVLVGSNAGGQ